MRALSPRPRFGSVLLGLLLSAPALLAQPAHPGMRAPAELLSRFELGWEARGDPGDADAEIVSVLVHFQDHPSADVEFLLSGLERLALAGGQARMSAQAAALMSIPASVGRSRPMPGVLPRLIRVYRRSGDPLVRSSVLSALGEIATDRVEAIAFLERVAADERDDFAVMSAIRSLSLQGEEGRAALQRLHAARAVQTPEARVILESMSRSGFPDPRR